MTWVSTAQYYRLANQLVTARFPGRHSARCVLLSVDSAEVDILRAVDDWEGAGRLLAGVARRVEAAGADLLLLCSNMMHRVASDIESAVTIPFLDIRDVIGAAVTGAGLRRVGLLGTSPTMEQPFYRDRLADHGVDAVIPGAADRALVHRVIVDELALDLVSERSRAAGREVIGRLVDDGCEGIVLGCTELELLFDASDAPVPLFPSTRLHVEAAVERLG